MGRFWRLDVRGPSDHDDGRRHVHAPRARQGGLRPQPPVPVHQHVSAAVSRQGRVRPAPLRPDDRVHLSSPEPRRLRPVRPRSGSEDRRVSLFRRASERFRRRGVPRGTGMSEDRRLAPVRLRGRNAWVISYSTSVLQIQITRHRQIVMKEKETKDPRSIWLTTIMGSSRDEWVSPSLEILQVLPLNFALIILIFQVLKFNRYFFIIWQINVIIHCQTNAIVNCWIQKIQRLAITKFEINSQFLHQSSIFWSIINFHINHQSSGSIFDCLMNEISDRYSD